MATNVQPLRSPDTPGLALLRPKDFKADPGYYLDWMCKNSCDLAIRDGYKHPVVAGLMIMPRDAANETTIEPDQIIMDRATFVANVDDVIEVLRSGKVSGQIRFDDGDRPVAVHVFSEGVGLLTPQQDGGKPRGFDRPLSELIAEVQRARKIDPKSAPAREASIAKSTPRYEPAQPAPLRVQAAQATMKLVRATVKASKPVVREAYQAWQKRDRQAVQRVASEVVRQVREAKRGLGD